MAPRDNQDTGASWFNYLFAFASSWKETATTWTTTTTTTTRRTPSSVAYPLPPRRDTVSNSLPLLILPPDYIINIEGRRRRATTSFCETRQFKCMYVCMEGTRERTWRIRNGRGEDCETRGYQGWREREREKAIPRDSIESDDIRAWINKIASNRRGNIGRRRSKHRRW